MLDFPEDESSLHRLLNKEFFENYDSGYFRDKAILYGGILAKPDEYLGILKDGYKVGKIEAGKMKNADGAWAEKFAKQELVINSYHSTESFFRVMFACLESPKCPWLGLVNLSSPYDFKKRVEQILKREYFIDGHEDALISLFIGGRKYHEGITDDEWQNAVSFVVRFVDSLADDLLKTPDYNVFKHGAALFNTQFGFELEKILKMEKQDTFVYLTERRNKKEKTEEFVLERNLKFMKWEYRFAVTYITSMLLNNLIAGYSVKLKVNEKMKMHQFHTFKFDELFETGIITQVMSQTLRTNVYRKKQKRKGK